MRMRKWVGPVLKLLCVSFNKIHKSFGKNYNFIIWFYLRYSSDKNRTFVTCIEMGWKAIQLMMHSFTSKYIFAVIQYSEQDSMKNALSMK